MNLKEAQDAVIEILGEEKAKIWWTQRNPHLGNMIPIEMLAFGIAHKLFAFIEDALEDHRLFMEKK